MPDCIEWKGYRDRDGYGRVKRNGRSTPAHRAAWIDEHGDIPTGMYVCHTCDNPPCVNIEHLFLGTQSDNMNDAVAKGRHARCSGEQHGRHKITAADVAAIRDSVEQGTVLARRYGVGKSTIYDIKQNRTWKDDPH